MRWIERSSLDRRGECAQELLLVDWHPIQCMVRKDLRGSSIVESHGDGLQPFM